MPLVLPPIHHQIQISIRLLEKLAGVTPEPQAHERRQLQQQQQRCGRSSGARLERTSQPLWIAPAVLLLACNGTGACWFAATWRAPRPRQPLFNHPATITLP